MKARYNRISTANQNIERQLAKQNPGEVLFNDVISGSVAFEKRDKGKELIENIKNNKYNYVVVSSIDRLGRNLYDIINTMDFFNKNNVTLRVDNLGIESMISGKPNPTFNLIVSVMANVAEMERQTLLERQKEGIALAKLKGVYKGREKGTIDSDEDIISKYKHVIKHLNKRKSLRDTAKLCDISLGTVQKVKAVFERNKQNIPVEI